jgi:hypothetical protein
LWPPLVRRVVAVVIQEEDGRGNDGGVVVHLPRSDSCCAKRESTRILPPAISITLPHTKSKKERGQTKATRPMTTFLAALSDGCLAGLLAGHSVVYF